MKKPRHSEATKAKAREMRRNGSTYPEIAAEVGASEGTVYYWLNPTNAARTRARSAQWKREHPDRVLETERSYRERNAAAIDARTTRRRKAAAKLLKEREQKRQEIALKKGASEPVEEVYVRLRKVLAAHDSAPIQGNGEAHSAMSRAGQLLREAEDEIKRAMVAGA